MTTGGFADEGRASIEAIPERRDPRGASRAALAASSCLCSLLTLPMRRVPLVMKALVLSACVLALAACANGNGDAGLQNSTGGTGTTGNGTSGSTGGASTTTTAGGTLSLIHI